MVKLKQYQTEARTLDIERALTKTEHMKEMLLFHQAAVEYYEKAIARRIQGRPCGAEGCQRMVHGAANKRYCSSTCRNAQCTRRFRSA